MLSVKEQIDEQDKLISSKLLQLQPYLFPASSESEFKLLAQGKVESVLSDANCNIDSIGWKSRSKVEQSLIRWTLEARYKGNAECALKAIRTFEHQKPVINISEYSLGGREVSGSKRNNMVIQINLVMWQNAKRGCIMKWFIGFLCLLTVYLLFDGLSLSAHSSSDKKHKYTSSQSINPVKEQEVLPVEKEWLAYLQEQEEKNRPQKHKNNKVHKPPYPTITIGEHNYQLLGIFKKINTPLYY
ncbi:hypothetical protein ACOBV8_06220 [Pseudoalteromonas espejiana]